MIATSCTSYDRQGGAGPDAFLAGRGDLLGALFRNVGAANDLLSARPPPCPHHPMGVPRVCASKTRGDTQTELRMGACAIQLKRPQQAG